MLGLDDVLHGGLPRNRLYLVEGDPGAGKTTLALQFLMEGVRQGEPGLYVTLSETREELLDVAASHGFSLDGIQIYELVPLEETLRGRSDTTIFHPSEIELGETTRAIMAEVERASPRRVAFDSLSEMRLLAQSPLRYRRQILAFKQFFSGRECTVLLLDDRTAGSTDLQLHSIAHGVIALEQMAPVYGAERRRIKVLKMRGTTFRGGYHDFRIRTGGLEVFPRLVASEHHREFATVRLATGREELDRMLGGGLDWGTSTLLIGAAGTGKSSFATSFVLAAVAQGRRAAYFAFDESISTLEVRSAGIGMDLKPAIAAGSLRIQQVDPAEMSPGEFAVAVRNAVEQDGVTLLVIDSLNGYINAMPEEGFLTVQLHELLTYLGQQGVLSLLVMGQQGLVGTSLQAPLDASYLADTVVLFRHVEAGGALHKAIAVVKKRRGSHQRTIRELRIDASGVSIGGELDVHHGVLQGAPTSGHGHDGPVAT